MWVNLYVRTYLTSICIWQYIFCARQTEPIDMLLETKWKIWRRIKTAHQLQARKFQKKNCMHVNTWRGIAKLQDVFDETSLCRKKQRDKTSTRHDFVIRWLPVPCSPGWFCLCFVLCLSFSFDFPRCGSICARPLKKALHNHECVGVFRF